MDIKFRSVLLVLMSGALFFGFLHLFVPEGTNYNFERLHIFLFNLCSGGTIVLYYTEKQRNASEKVILFGVLSLSYAVFAFFKIYIPAMVISLILAMIVESVRIRRFSFFPHNFFSPVAPISEKFHHASLLCLSTGLLISCSVILNNEYLKLVTLPKLKLDTFFLGFSFPLSLITMSVMFSLMKENDEMNVRAFKDIGFWNINMGVIIFFLFILFEKLVPQVIVTIILFLTVMMIFYLFAKLGLHVQQKNFLLSGMSFLLVTAITGIAYIVLEFFPEYHTQYGISKLLLKIHSFASLYGWNLSGLAVICRYEDFPIQLHSKGLIAFHWITVLVFAPLGIYFSPFAVCTIICYTIFLYMLFSSKGKKIV